MRTWRLLVLSTLGCLLSAGMTGCESLQKKFTRKPKHPQQGLSPIITFEDFAGNIEVLVFPKAFPLMESNLKEDAVVLVRGKLSMREDRPKLLADGIVPLVEAWGRQVIGLKIRLAQATGRQILEDLKETLKKNPGPVPVELSFGNGHNGGVRIAVGPTLQVNPSLSLLQTLVKLVGQEAISIKK